MTATFIAVLMARNPMVAAFLICFLLFLPIAVLCEIVARADYYASKAKPKKEDSRHG